MNSMKIKILLLAGMVCVLHSMHSTKDTVKYPVFEQLGKDIDTGTVDIKKLSTELLDVLCDLISHRMKVDYNNKTLAIENTPHFMAMYRILHELAGRKGEKKDIIELYQEETDRYLSSLTFDDLVCISCSQNERKNPLMWEIRGESSPGSRVNEFVMRKGIPNTVKDQFSQKRQKKIDELIKARGY